MSYRSRPILDRKHRPRWQDELRTQRLLVAGFVMAIAAALGIFGVTTWNSYYDQHLQRAIVVGDVSVDRDALAQRGAIIASELQAKALDLQTILGGARDSLVQQQLQAISSEFTNLAASTSSSLADGLLMGSLAASFGITVTPAQIDAEIAYRQSIPERIQLSLITVDALPAAAPAGTEPTDEDFSRARGQADLLRGQLNAGADFAQLARDRSDDPATSASDGLIGWVEAGDAQYDAFVQSAAEVARGGVIGPLRTDSGWAIVRVEARTAGHPNQVLIDALAAAGVSAEEYRAYITDQLMRIAYRTYFTRTLAVSPAYQREIAQILISNDQGVPVPKRRLRHLLAQPIPGAADQSVATDEQWEAALARAEAWRTQVLKPDADWYAIAKESDDPGSRDSGGDLGWYDPTSSQFVPEFVAGLSGLQLDEVSEPVKTAFGYHVIQVTDQRTTAVEYAERTATQLKADPSTFAEVARAVSEDGTASRGGYKGWVAHFQETQVRQDAIFALDGLDSVSDPVIDGGSIWIFKLLNEQERRGIEPSRLNTIRSVGFSRWLAQLRSQSTYWIDPLFQAPAG